MWVNLEKKVVEVSFGIDFIVIKEVFKSGLDGLGIGLEGV